MASVNFALSFVATAQTKTTIGFHPELGGYVFQLSADKMHGLVAETTDIEDRWTFYAAREIMKLSCVHNSVGAKFSDWRLPSKDELNNLYLQKNAIGGFFAGEYYWSSSEYDGSDAWVQYISNGNQTNSFKFYTYSVRAVRAF